MFIKDFYKFLLYFFRVLITHLPELPVKSIASEQVASTSTHSFLQPALPKRLKNASKLVSGNLNIIVEDEDSDDDIINK